MRFFFEYLEYFFNQFVTRIEAIYDEKPKNPYKEPVENLLAIVALFAEKPYRSRSHKKKQLVQKFKKLLEEVKKNG